MIRFLATMLLRVLLETALLCFAVALLLLVVSFRIGRHLFTSQPDRLEKLSGQALQAAALLPALSGAFTGRGVDSAAVGSEPILDPDEEEVPA